MKALCCRKILAKDLRIFSRNYVLGLCRQIHKKGLVGILEDKIKVPRVTWLFKITKLYRLTKIIQEATRLLAFQHGLMTKGMQCSITQQCEIPSQFREFFDSPIRNII